MTIWSRLQVRLSKELENLKMKRDIWWIDKRNQLTCSKKNSCRSILYRLSFKNWRCRLRWKRKRLRMMSRVWSVMIIVGKLICWKEWWSLRKGWSVLGKFKSKSINCILSTTRKVKITRGIYKNRHLPCPL